MTYLVFSTSIVRESCLCNIGHATLMTYKRVFLHHFVFIKL